MKVILPPHDNTHLDGHQTLMMLRLLIPTYQFLCLAYPQFKAR